MCDKHDKGVCTSKTLCYYKVLYGYIWCARYHKPTTFCSQSWLIAESPSAQRGSKCQAIVFTTASQMGEWPRRNSDSLEGSKPPLLSSLTASLPTCPPSSPKLSPCHKQANQCRLANCPRACAYQLCCAECSLQQRASLTLAAHCLSVLK